MTLTVTALARPPMLAELSFALAPGVTALVGPNGAGKTTLLRAIAGLMPGPGEVRLDGQPLTAAAFAYLPAERTVHFPITARDTVALGLARPDPTAVAAALARTDTARFADTTVTRLSTGERARVLLARALVGRPRVLLLDEPAANLDPAHALLVIDLLHQEAGRGAIVLVAMHDLTLARRANRAIVLEGGCRVTDADPNAALDTDVLARVFGVREGAKGLERAL